MMKPVYGVFCTLLLSVYAAAHQELGVLTNGADLVLRLPEPLITPPPKARLRRQFTSECGFINADVLQELSCSAGYACKFKDDDSAAGCCRLADYNSCVLPETCIETLASTTAADARTTICTNRASRFCYSNLYIQNVATYTELGCTNTPAITNYVYTTYTGYGATIGYDPTQTDDSGPLPTESSGSSGDDSGSSSSDNSGDPSGGASSGSSGSSGSSSVSRPKKKSNAGAIAGGVVGGIVFLALLAGFLYWGIQNQRRAAAAEAAVAAASTSAPASGSTTTELAAEKRASQSADNTPQQSVQPKYQPPSPAEISPTVPARELTGQRPTYELGTGGR